MKTLSVIMPIYNIEDCLVPSLESFVSDDLDMDLFELLMIDDGSTDSCPDICKEYEARYPGCFKYMRKENGHYGTVLNYGIDHAEGMFWRIVDGDDRADPKGLNELCLFLKEHPGLDMCLSDYEVLYPSTGKIEYMDVKLPAREVFNFGDWDYFPPNMHSITYKTSILQENSVRMDGGVAFTDIECSLYPLPHVQKVAYVPVSTYIYMMERDGQSVDPKGFLKMMKDRRFVLSQMLNWYDSLEATDYVKHFVERRLGYFLSTDLERCLRASNTASECKSVFMETDALVASRPSVYACYDSKPAKFLKSTGYRGFGLMKKLKQIQKPIKQS